MIDRPHYKFIEDHAHGFGPLLVGGGGFFGVLNEISPALIDYTGPVQSERVCPNGFARVEHHHEFGDSAIAALVSWLLVFNIYHRSKVEWSCLRAPLATP